MQLGEPNAGIICGALKQGVLERVNVAHASMETVWLKDLTTEFQTEKRTQGNLNLPDELTFHIRRMSGDLILNLKRNHGIDPNADIYMTQTTNDGQSVLMKTRDLEESDVAYYQDVENFAFMTVRCVKRSKGQCDRVINGNIHIGDSNYDIRPAKIDVTSREVQEVQGRFGRRYVLEDQTHISRDRSNLEHDIMAPLRHIDGQHKQNHFSHSDAMLSSTNEITESKRVAKDKTRQPRSMYYVKLAVVIDSTLYALYSALEPSKNPFTRTGKVNKRIRESYSHIVNGADLRYKRIQDPGISMTVILSSFVIFKQLSDLKQYNSKVIFVNGTSYIDERKYMLDLIIWDNEKGKKIVKHADNVMLFTRHQLYDGEIHDTSAGVSVLGGVCVVGTRLSIIQALDSLSTSLAAAHELGHSLGADHDGEGNAIACRADDFFIMTDKEPGIHPSIEYSRNLWIFSNCSVEAFKRTLQSKPGCARQPAAVYDPSEYAGFIKQMEGEVYSLDIQCHIIIGPGSVYCGIRPLNMCYLQCTDPRTGTCKNRYYSAASGTQCGSNMWCIEARCVRKG